MIDLPGLAALAAASRSREDLTAAGYLPLAKSGDLHRVGYNVVFWGHAATGAQCIEYVPRKIADWSSILPRVTIDTWESQAALHRALGIGVVGPGEQWHPRLDLSPGLFDAEAA